MGANILLSFLARIWIRCRGLWLDRDEIKPSKTESKVLERSASVVHDVAFGTPQASVESAFEIGRSIICETPHGETL